jgi:7,8-dihydropterin-6-yl-methyl-4-(beta-D-ribofuranosyl)aminobenzene 5'-phosphate synthase
MTNTPLKITVIVENKSNNKNLSPEHGLSLLIEYDNNHLLFDTGASNLITRNAANLNIDINNIDYIVLSHGHNDHVGGLASITNKKVYAHPDIFIPKYKKRNDQYIYDGGFTYSKEYYEKKNSIEFVWVNNELQLTENIKIHTGFKKEKHNDFYLKVNDNYLPDYFNDELALSIETTNGIIIVTGCAHSGIINIIDKIISDDKNKNIYAILGGFHLGNATSEKIESIAKIINNYNVNMIGISHCTGNKLAKYLKNSKVFNFNTGDIFT